MSTFRIFFEFRKYILSFSECVVKMSADALKNEGNELLKKNDLEGAIGKYTEAIAINPSNKVFFSNRSAAYAKNSDYQKAHE